MKFNRKLLFIMFMCFVNSKLWARKLICTVKMKQTSGYLLSSQFELELVKTAGANVYGLKELNFNYIIHELMEADKEDLDLFIWHQDTFSVDKLKNNENYRPRKYRNYLQFSDIGNKKTFAKIDLLIPKLAFSTNQNFNSRVIFTSVLDHWGGSAYSFCRNRENK